MFEKWRVLQISKNIEGGEAQEVVAYDTEKEAYSQFYYRCDKVGTNPSTAKCEIMIIDPDGDRCKVEKIDNTRFASAEVTE